MYLSEIATKTPPPIEPTLSRQKTFKFVGKLSEVLTSGVSQDSVPIITSAFILSIKFWSSRLLLQIDRQFTLTILKLFIDLFGTFVTLPLTGVEVANGSESIRELSWRMEK